MTDDRLPIRVPKSGALVASSIRQMIVRGEVDEGDVLPPEGVLTERFDVSRPTLREAFRILESEGLISVRRGSRGGARVHPPSESVAARYAAVVLQSRAETIAGFFRARVIVEAPAASMLARRARSSRRSSTRPTSTTRTSSPGSIGASSSWPATRRSSCSR
jgi:GntR family transcriptional repressor for pyruvate dehydrogenase complex